MGQGVTSRFSLGTGSVRLAMAAAAAAIVLVVCGVLAVAGVASGEVVATALFLPVFLVALYGGRSAGYVAAAVTTAVYVVVRRGDMESAGVAAAAALIVTRCVAYAVAAHIGAYSRSLAADRGAPDRARSAGAANGARRAAPAPSAAYASGPGPS